MKNSGILGCGWLGFPLAKTLISEGFNVRGTTRNTDKINDFITEIIDHYSFELGDEIPINFLKDLTILIIAFPVTTKISSLQMEVLLSSLSKIKNPALEVIFTSSISVYHDNQGVINEENGTVNPMSPNFIFEQKLTKIFNEKLTILRLGGLISEDRHPVFHLAGKTNLLHGNAPINLVHRKDVISIIHKIITIGKFGHVYNCVNPWHPEKQKYYSRKALEFELTPPMFNLSEKKHKLVESTKVMQFLDVEFHYSL